MWDLVQSNLNTIIIALISLVTTVVLSLLAILQKRLILLIDSKASVSEREMIYKVANEAFSLAEKAFKEPNINGQSKLNFAFSYTSEHLGKAGIKVSSDEIKAAIEKAVLDYNAKTKKSS